MSKVKKFFRAGDVFIWFTGLGLGLTLVMISGLMYLIFANGSDYYYPSSVAEISTNNKNAFLGEIHTVEEIPKHSLPDSLQKKGLERYKVKIGNREIYGLDFKWFDEREIDSITYPKNAAVIERMEFGNFHGFIKGIKKNGELIYDTPQKVNENIDGILKSAVDLRNEINDIGEDEIGSINHKIENLRLEIKKIKFHSENPEEDKIEIATIENEIENYQKNYHSIENRVDSLRKLSEVYSLVTQTADGSEKDIPFVKIVRIYYTNNMGFFGTAGYIISKISEFLFDDPRESNTEGGVWPAIFGTVMMVILMSLFAVPFGVIAAIYLREYAKQGVLVRTVRIAVNNLAGVPSIVFGVFGLGFFIYFVGGTIDKLFFAESLPTPTWGTGGILWASLTLALLTVPVVIVSTEEALASIPRGIREAALALGSTKWQVIRKVVLPASAPGILTGVILAMARGAGEVAPLMITGVVKLAPNLPLDGNFPFIHLDRKFMHLGFHIYDVGFQSPNVEAALPMVYMTTLLLILIVVLLNISAMIIRNKLREKYKSATF